MLLLNRLLAGAFARAYAPPSLCYIDDGDEAGFGGGSSLDALVDSITAKLDDAPAEPGDGAATATQNQADASNDGGDDDAHSDEESVEDKDEANAEPEETPAIEPPASWKAELRDRWKQLPADLQRDLAQWETERNAGVNKRLEEAAEARKAIEPELEAARHERQRYAEQLNTYVAWTEALDPILAEGQRTDWAKAALEDPAGTQAKWFAFTQRQQQLQNAVRQRDALMGQQMQEHMANEGRKLIEAVPEWNDADQNKALEKAKAGIDTVRKMAVDDYGFRPEEVAVIRDHRIARAFHDLVKLRAEKAEWSKRETDRAAAAKATEQKRQAPAPRLAASSGQGQSNTGIPSRSGSNALRKIGRDANAPFDKRVDSILAQF